MRIALFADTYPPQINGVATATKTLRDVLVANGNEVLVVTVALLDQKKITYSPNLIRIPGITAKKLYNYKFTGVFYPEVYKEVEKFNPDVIHVQTEVGVGVFGRICARNLGIPVVYTYHTMYDEYTYYVSKGIKPIDDFAKRAIKVWFDILADTSTEITTPSVKTMLALKKWAPDKYINVIPNGLDLKPFDKKKLAPAKLEELRNKYFHKDKKNLLILGRLAKEKSIDVVFKLVNDYIEKNGRDKINLLVVGDGPYKEKLEEINRKIGIDDITTFVGAVEHSEVAYFYNLADCYISASLTETQGLTYIEAMASGTIVLARKDKNLEETVIEGKTGFLFDKEEEFSPQLEKVFALTKTEREKILEDSYNNVMNLFGLDLYYKRMMNVYNKARRKYW